jgi:hypothetical protein
MNPVNKTININKILESGPDIFRVISHAKALLKLQSLIRSNINQPESDHIYLASVSQETVILYTDSPAWAAKLRFRTQQLIDIMRNYLEFPHINTIRIKVSPVLNKGENLIKIAGLSQKTAKLLEETAQNMDDQELKSALLRLSKLDKSSHLSEADRIDKGKG